MNRFLVYALYNLLLPVVLVLGFPRFVMKGIQRGGLARNFRQRLGHFQPEVREKLARPGNLWIHAVSVGEVIVALKLIRELRRQSPDANLVLSTTTTTGFRLAETEAAADRDHVTVIHNPVDLPWITRRVLRLIRPDRLVLVEAEVWPNLVRQARGLDIPVVLVNARLSDRSERRFRRFGSLTRVIFSQIDRVGVPFEGDGERWASLGIPIDHISLTGSVKFDETHEARPDAQIAELHTWLTDHGLPANARLLLAGSTHSGEEALIGRAYLQLRERFPDLAYVVVPRHAERALEVVADLRQLGFAPILKIPAKTGDETPLDGEKGQKGDGDIPAWIANTTGELRAWYFLSDVVIVGKSLLGRGGQNPVEPIVAGKPLIVGPHMQNFRAIVNDLVSADGIRQISDVEVETLSAAIEYLLSDPAAGEALANCGKTALSRHHGAAARTAALILQEDAENEA